MSRIYKTLASVPTHGRACYTHQHFTLPRKILYEAMSNVIMVPLWVYVGLTSIARLHASGKQSTYTDKFLRISPPFADYGGCGYVEEGGVAFRCHCLCQKCLSSA